MPLIEKRYTEALVGLALKADAIAEYQQELKAIADIYENENEFRLFLINPEVNSDVKKTVIYNIFNDRIKKELVNFLSLLLDKGRMRNLPGISAEFAKEVSKLKNTIDITIVSATSLDSKETSRIVDKYKTLYSAVNAKLKLEIDKNLIGGVKVKIGDKVSDGTIKRRLQDLREILIES